ncbi:putative nucleotidyltransferase with HDIG domain [Ruminiclostridium sufflavum DSM 19573]|uniref:Putative nucleotidyltransferase with HDIG domain n=1 Tax=Ruminiclostridium sufflavum DSM 19573 TaxID=1121337 RepID=A0A318XTZ6_9FIRM|nr:HD domain-containing phosphohydrolase [Ruminiclostridium sufflavum]PYG85812.1 putative nucleotidyltransferase with HDIG domain [Ruminiclostridium sufflavum DSM 19573]
MDIFTGNNAGNLIYAFFAIIIIILLAVIWRYRKKLNKMELVSLAGINMSSGAQQKLIQRIMEVAKQQVQAEACSLYFVNDETKELYFGVALGEKGSLLKELRFKIDDSFIAGWVATYKKTLNIRDVDKDKRFRNREVAKNFGLNEKSFLTMPIIFDGKLVAVLQMINKQNGRYFSKADEETMEMLIDKQIAPNLEKARVYSYMQELFNDSIQTIANAIDARDEYTQGHCTRVAEYSVMIGKELGLEFEELVSLRYAAVLHDVGKIGIRDSILNSKQKLTKEEFEEMKTHVIKGAKILEQISKTNPDIVYGVKYHHERYDGKGYCESLKGEEIPLFARIIAVADTFDAMTSNRPYRKEFPEEAAVAELIRGAGTQYDKRVVDAFVRCFEGQN